MDLFFEMVVYSLQKAGEDGRMVLMEDALILWNLLLKLPSLEYTEPIHNLFTSFLEVYSCDKSYYTVLMNILDLYIQLGKQTFIHFFAKELTTVYHTYLGMVTSRELPRLASSIHSLLILYPTEGTQIVAPMIDSILTTLVQKHQQEKIEKYACEDVLNRLMESTYVSYLLIVCQFLMSGDEGLAVIGVACQKLQMGFVENIHWLVDAQLFFAVLLSLLLESFDSAGGGALGYVRRTLFVQCMLQCMLHGSQEQLSSLEEVCDCILNVLSEMEVGEEKMRLLFTEKSHLNTDGLSEEYLRKFISQSNIRQSFAIFIDVGLIWWYYE